MLILLPPSETKTRPADGARLDLASLGSPRLADARASMLRAAMRTATGRDAGARLGVPASAPELIGRMAAIDAEPTAPALEVYSGVLYDQLGGAGPSEDRDVLVMSALLGVVDPATDRIPAYRLSASSDVQRLGKAGPWWRKHLAPLAPALLEHVGRAPSPLVLDCRSGAYRAMMPMRSAADVRVLEVAPVQERDGRRTVISHDAKRFRGLVTRALLEDRRPVRDADALVGRLAEAFAGRLGIELHGDRLVLVDRVS